MTRQRSRSGVGIRDGTANSLSTPQQWCSTWLLSSYQPVRDSHKSLSNGVKAISQYLRSPSQPRNRLCQHHPDYVCYHWRTTALRVLLESIQMGQLPRRSGQCRESTNENDAKWVNVDCIFNDSLLNVKCLRHKCLFRLVFLSCLPYSLLLDLWAFPTYAS